MFGAKKEDAVEKSSISKYITYGIHELKINDIEIEYSTQKGTPRLKFHMETRPVTDAGFEADEAATSNGKVGFVRSQFLANEAQMKELSNNMIILARHLGEAEEQALDNFYAESLEVYVEKVKSVVKNKYCWFKMCGEEYIKSDGKTGLALKFARYGFVNKDGNKLRFDENNIYDLKKIDAEPDPDPPKQDEPKF